MDAPSASTWERNADGDQDLNLWARELEDVVREIMQDPVFKGNQNFKFEVDLDEAGRRLFGGEAKAGVAFQIGQLRYVILLNIYVPVTYMYVICTFIVYTGMYNYIHVYSMYVHV